MLKRILAIVLLAGAALFILSSSSSTPDYEIVKSSVEDEQIVESVTVEVNSYHYDNEINAFYFNLFIKNNTAQEYLFSPYAWIEYKGTDGEWYSRDYGPYTVFTDARILSGNSTIESYSTPVLGWHDNILVDGEYRIKISAKPMERDNFGNVVYFAAEFEVK